MKAPIHSFINLLVFFIALCPASGQHNFADCNTALILCDKSPLHFQEISGFGSILEASPGHCFRAESFETNSLWIKWQAASTGTLTFSITPFAETNDIDFVLCRTTSLNDFSNYEVVRCMAAGPTIGDDISKLQNCTGATGLRESAVTAFQTGGCPGEFDNFLSALDMTAGDYYTLYINNFRSSGGINIEWGGSGTFQQIPGQCTPNSSTTSDPQPTQVEGMAFSLPFPNPANNTVSIQINAPQQLSGTVQIIGSDGTLASESEFSLQAGSNSLTLPTKNLRPGIYSILFLYPTGNRAVLFVKQ